jgi:hypothetical protein
MWDTDKWPAAKRGFDLITMQLVTRLITADYEERRVVLVKADVSEEESVNFEQR